MRAATTLALAAALVGCSGMGEGDFGGVPSEHDGGTRAPDGGGPVDMGADGLPASPETPGYREGDDLDPSTGASMDEPVCFLADAEPAPYECDAALLDRCPDLRSCCVGDGDCCSAVTGGSLPDGALGFDGCPDGDAVSCLGMLGIEATGFGDPQPRVQGGALLPNGDDSYDSGLTLGEPVDLTAHRVELHATFARPTDCGATCIEGVGVGFSAQETFGDTTHVRLMVGLLYSASRDDVSLVVGDEVARSWDLEADEESWSLVVRPTGELDVARAGAVVHSAELAPTAAARLVVYGRNHNRPADSPLGARLTALSVSTALCDMPSAWPGRAQLSFREPGSAAWGPSFLHAPTVARDGSGATLVAFEHEGDLIVARPQEGGPPTDFDLAGSPDASVVPAPDTGFLTDPELYWDADTAQWVLFYTIDEGDEASIGRAVGDGETFVPDADPILKSDAATRVRIEQPTVQRHHTGTWVMVARVTDASAIEHLALFLSDDGVSWTAWDDGHLGPITRRGDVSGSGFDADEIAHPSLIVHDGAWQLYYAGRRGTRWGVGLLVSDELLRWRWVSDGRPVLAGDGNGFDRVGTGAPDAASVGQTVELYYEGTDGTRIRLGRAERQAAAFGTRSF